MNPYDYCIFNKLIKGLKLMTVFHVDDFKCSHYEESVVEDLLKQVSDQFGKEKSMPITRGQKHDYLGMTIDYE